MARRISSWFLLLCTLAMVGCDHATKFAASSALRGAPQAVLPGILDLGYTENHDTAFSVLRLFAIRPQPGLLLATATGGLVLVALLFWRRRHSASWLERFGWALTLAGALGNFLDRLVRGYVVDFIHVHHWPVFNVADIAVVAGAIALAIGMRPAIAAHAPRS